MKGATTTTAVVTTTAAVPTSAADILLFLRPLISCRRMGLTTPPGTYCMSGGRALTLLLWTGTVCLRENSLIDRRTQQT